MNFKEIKKYAKSRLKKNYVLFVLTCMLAAFLGSAYIGTFSDFAVQNNSLISEEVTKLKDDDTSSAISINAGDVLADLLEDKISQAKNISSEIEKMDIGTDKTIGFISVQYSRGVFAKVVNSINSGSFLITLYTAILSIISSKNVARAIFIGVVALIVLFIQFFIKNLYKVTFRRIFMEGDRYDKIPYTRFMFLYRVRKVLRATFSAFFVSVYELLWDLTIIGGFIKRYEYYMVPYILAENPTLDSLEAVRLSRNMMKGHKFELFKLEISFIGWWLLGMLSFGLTEVLFSNPYEECVYTHYYSLRRKEAIENKIEGYELLNDRYLFDYASTDILKEAYTEIFEIQKENIDLNKFRHTGIRGFFENNFGLVLVHDSNDILYSNCLAKIDKLNEFKEIIDNSQYPTRLYPLKENSKGRRIDNVNYLRHYALPSVILMFIGFSFIGWLWEVSLHLLQTGEFVNRGVLHGPWLPIYGSGGVLILLLLYRLRNKPWVYVLSTTVLCGFVEYMTSWYLELTKGVRWWDYSGYFLNINGRICAEGLLVFAMAGMAITYMLAPIIDDYVSKANPKIIVTLSSVLVILFSADFIYSIKNPNTGTGVTDCDDETSYIETDNRL